MASTRVATRYAKAVMEMAKEEHAFDAVVADFLMLRNAIEGSSDLRNLLLTPIIDVRKKESILREIFEGKLTPLMDRFVTLMTLKGRASDLIGIVTAFERLIDQERNVVAATITVAVDLDVEQRKRLETHVERLSGHHVRPTYVVDPHIIGGFRVRFEDQMIDASVRHQLERLRESFMTGSMN